MSELILAPGLHLWGIFLHCLTETILMFLENVGLGLNAVLDVNEPFPGVQWPRIRLHGTEMETMLKEAFIPQWTKWTDQVEHLLRLVCTCIGDGGGF